MKKLLLTVFVLAFALSLSAFAVAAIPMTASDFILDEADMLTAEQEQELEQKAQQIADTHEVGIYVAILSDHYDYSEHIGDLGYDTYYTNELGVGADKNGVLLVYDLLIDHYYTFAQYGPKAEPYFTAEADNAMGNEFFTFVNAGDHYAAMNLFLDYCASALSSAPVKPSVQDPMFSEGGFVIDQADILTDEQEQQLEAMGQRIWDNYQMGAYVVVLNDFTDYSDSTRDAADDIFLYNGLGYGSGQDGTLLMLSMADRDFWHMAHGDFGNATVTDYGREMLTEDYLSYFANDNWFGGFETFFVGIEEYSKLAREGEPFDVGSYINPIQYVIAAGIGVVIAAITCLTLKAQLKSAKMRDSAVDYVTGGGVQLRIRDDQYTHTTTSRRHSPRSKSSSGGSGGGTSVGSRGTSGGGGKF